MAVFSTNQNRQLFVEKELAGAALTAADKTVGKLGVRVDASSPNTKYVWVEQIGHGGLVSSDKIPVKNIVAMKATKSKHMTKPLNRVKIALDTDIQNLAGAQVVAGQDYILNLEFYQYIGLSDDTTYLKQAMVHGVAGMTNDIFYKTLAISLAKNLSRELEPLVKVYVHSAGATTNKFDAEHLAEVTARHTVSGGAGGASNDWYNGSGTATDIDYIVIEQAEQPWILGKLSYENIPFNIQFSTITVAGDEVLWGKSESLVPNEAKKIQNGKDIADLEWFCMGERGDQYRGVGYPNNLETKYMVDPSKKYDTLDITYYYAGEGVDVQQSQKVLTIVSEDAGSNQLMTALVNKFKTAAGLTIPFE